MPDQKGDEGFVIRDHRGVDGDDSGNKGSRQEPPVAEINFSTFILSLGSSVMLNFGDIPDPVTGNKEKNLPMAKQTIDILTILREKTRGNLTEDEEKLFENILAELQMQYVNLLKVA